MCVVQLGDTIFPSERIFHCGIVISGTSVADVSSLQQIYTRMLVENLKKKPKPLEVQLFSAYEANAGIVYLIYCYSSSFQEKMVLFI